ncbi:hypothetical protein [Frankia sp. QA3]|uniref:hypothetical protein n=1 Tax=Frankia sp. QA3 TaxID=710111 RepID=UPI0002F9A387|nr:hypothetical protein [Frankia sp. QA3]
MSLAHGTALRLAGQRVRYAEITITPWTQARRGIDPAAMFAGLDRGRRAAEEEVGIQVRRIAETALAWNAASPNATPQNVLDGTIGALGRPVTHSPRLP